MSWKIPLFKTYSDQNDIEAVTNVLKRGTNWAVGKEITEFESKLAEFTGAKFALAFNSGTSALHTLLLACNVQNSEIIVPTFTFIATANAVLLTGATPVFAESESETFGLNVEDVEKKITERTKAVILIHYGGCASRDTEKIKKLCERKNIILLDDAAESLGASINDKKIGTLSHAAMFSFCQNKIISSGEGGAVVTNDQKLYEKMKLLRSCGRVEEGNKDYFTSIKDSDYLEVGYNFRMPTMNAALALSQLNKIDFLIKKRKSNAEYLTSQLSQIRGIKCPLPPAGFNHVYQMYTIILENNRTRDQLQSFLEKKKIMTKVYFNPIHMKTLYRRRFNYKEGDFPTTESISKKVLTLPLYPDMRKEELDYIIDNIKEFFYHS